MTIEKLDINDKEQDSKSMSGINLNTRLSINARYQSRNFHEWHHKVLNVLPGEHVLDVGCGTGTQSLKFLQNVLEEGTVTSIDISPDSIAELLSCADGDQRLQAEVADMANLQTLLASSFRKKKFSLTNSTYALYYSSQWRDVLKTMAESLENNGRLSVFSPTTPHGMVDIASRFSCIPEEVTDSLTFGETVLLPEIRSLFWDVETHYFQSVMRVESLEDFMMFYKATTYYNPNATHQIEEFAEEQINKHGCVTYPKNGLLIIGRERKY